VWVGYRVRFVDVGLDHFTEDALPSDVPDLEGYLDVARELQPLHKEVNAYRLLILSLEVIFTKTHNKRSFSNSAVSQNNHLIL
jgi:hypothetical protein